MIKQNLKTIIIGALIAGVGIWIGHFIGGMITGATIFYVIATTVGRWAHNKMTNKMDKIFKDYILMRYKNK